MADQFPKCSNPNKKVAVLCLKYQKHTAKVPEQFPKCSSCINIVAVQFQTWAKRTAKVADQFQKCSSCNKNAAAQHRKWAKRITKVSDQYQSAADQFPPSIAFVDAKMHKNSLDSRADQFRSGQTLLQSGRAMSEMLRSQYKVGGSISSSDSTPSI